MSPRVVAVAAAGKEKERDAVAGMEVSPYLPVFWLLLLPML